MLREMAHRVPREFRFKEQRNARVFVCDRVVSGGAILYVSHDEDGDWQFLCGAEHGEAFPEDPGHVGCLECVVAGDESLNEIAGLPSGGVAMRDATTSAWEILTPDDD